MTHTGSWAWNVRTEALFWSREIFRIFDYDPEMTPTWDSLLKRVHPEDRLKIEQRKEMEFTQKEWTVSEIDFRIVVSDGTIKHLHSIAHPMMDESGNITEVVGTIVDVTERKRAEEALQRSEAYLADAQRLTHTGSWAFNARGGGDYWSEENFRIWGFDPQRGAPDLETLLQRIHPEDRDRVRESRVKALQARRDYDLQFRIVLPGGTTKHIQVSARPVFSATGDLIEVVGTHVDITERKRAEEERERWRQLEADLAHMNRVTMLGELASSLAHEINQPIAAAITSANACLRWLERNPPDLERARAAAKRIENDGSRAAEIIQRLRAFYKTGAPPERELVDINEVAGEMLALLGNEATRHSISLRTELAPQLPQIMADRVQLQQVLMNLMLNGIEAIADGEGELTIRSQSTEDGFLLTSVSDTGVGLPDEKPDRIFNAFYTTKPQGTGMGLAISRSIIEAHGGRLWATANSERGATFHFSLPAERQQ
jgi:PAS domain S-box-containing protein